MKKHIIVLLFATAGLLSALAQNGRADEVVNGFVYELNSKGQPIALPGAHVFSAKDKKGAVTKLNGEFSIELKTPFPHSLIASFVGYRSDTIYLNEQKEVKFILAQETLNQVDVLDRKKSNAKSLLQANNIEWISSVELNKAACCNLSESFTTNPSVDVSFTDAITGAKRIQMLGLDGVYTQVLSENMPLLRGLSASYGLSYIPGSWIESIQIAKGTGSVVNGFESLSGQINVELYKPNTADKLFWNTYVNSGGMIENNFILSSPVNADWSTALLGHYSYMGKSVDHNDDNFADDPKMKRLTLLNRWAYKDCENKHLQFGLRYLNEERISGQMTSVLDESDNFISPYEVNMNTNQIEFYSKTGYIFDKPGTSIGLMSSLRYHGQNISFGTSDYSGAQNSLYLNAIYQTQLKDSTKIFKVGASYYLDNYKEVLNTMDYKRDDRTVGVFSELHYKPNERFSSIIGFRADHSNRWGMWYNPRIHLRYNPTEDMVLRASIGKANRQANPLAENISYFFSDRSLELIQYTQDSLGSYHQTSIDYSEIKPEEAWNYGFNFAYCFYLFNKESTFNLDIYQTEFTQQLIVDIEDASRIKMYNLHGNSSSTSLQIDATIEPAEGWEFKFAQKWNQTKATFGAGNTSMSYIPFVPKHTSLVQLGYTAWQEIWDVNITLQKMGPSRVPSKGDVFEFWSPSFNMLSGQVTRKFKNFDWYLGVENALDYTQDNPIRNVENPFEQGFDAAMIWGPVMGRKIYSGIRVTFND